MNKQEIKHILTGFLSVTPTPDQDRLMDELATYLLDRERDKVFLLKGYAGTGKTTLISAIVKFLRSVKYKVQLLAPTGRAAKVMSGYAGIPAQTLHKKIYQRVGDESGPGYFTLSENKHSNTFFIIDEASMISNDTAIYTGFGTSRFILDDIFEYVHNGNNCQLIFCGDTAQLPPVGSSLSPALDPSIIEKNYSTKVYSYELKDVVRQKTTSGILENATQLRKAIFSPEVNFSQPAFEFDDFRNLNGMEFQEELERAYSQYGEDEVIIVTRSNNKANQYNAYIRSRLLYRENEVEAGDVMMAIKNNYFWTKNYDNKSFIANGESILINRVLRSQEIYGFRFADVEAEIPGLNLDHKIELKILLDAIMTKQASLPQEEIKKLFNAIAEDFTEENNKRGIKNAVLENEFFNALQVKFAYALTAHKSQGGQWAVVFVDAGMMGENDTEQDYYRWLYTAITRATQKVFFINYRPPNKDD